jgi:hypothetical protein
MSFKTEALKIAIRLATERKGVAYGECVKQLIFASKISQVDIWFKKKEDCELFCSDLGDPSPVIFEHVCLTGDEELYEFNILNTPFRLLIRASIEDTILFDTDNVCIVAMDETPCLKVMTEMWRTDPGMIDKIRRKETKMLVDNPESRRRAKGYEEVGWKVTRM